MHSDVAVNELLCVGNEWNDSFKWKRWIQHSKYCDLVFGIATSITLYVVVPAYPVKINLCKHSTDKNNDSRITDSTDFTTIYKTHFNIHTHWGIKSCKMRSVNWLWSTIKHSHKFCNTSISTPSCGHSRVMRRPDSWLHDGRMAGISNAGRCCHHPWHSRITQLSSWKNYVLAMWKVRRDFVPQ